MKHSPEPWQLEEVFADINSLTFANVSTKEGSLVDVIYGSIHLPNALRIIECVNAMEGIEDPKKYTEMVRNITQNALLLGREMEFVEQKYQSLKKVIQQMIDRIDENGGMHLRGDSIILKALKLGIEQKTTRNS